MFRVQLVAALRCGGGVLCCSHRRVAQSGGDHRPAAPGLRDAKQMNFGIDPKKLDLGLDLDNMDFTVIMKETRLAQAKEKQGAVNFQAEIEALNAALQRAEHPNASSMAGRDPSKRSIRGIAQAGGVHDANTPQAAYAQARRERSESQQSRYTLIDSLRDCSLSGNWSKACDLFESAVAKACRQAVPEGDEGACEPGSEREEACFDRMRKVNATLPAGAGFQARKNLQGVLRWNSNHVYWLFKVLFETDRTSEAQRAWHVLRSIGFIDNQLDARTLNGIIALVRHTSQRGTAATEPAQLVEPLLSSHPKTTAQLDQEKAFRREVTIALETLAQAKRIPLGIQNQKTAQRARIADAIRRGDGHGDGDGGGDESLATSADDASIPRAALQVGDFSGLLRVSQSEESSERVLAMMDKLNISKTGDTYAALVGALHNPVYRLSGIDASEIVPGPSRRPVRANGQPPSPPDGATDAETEETPASLDATGDDADDAVVDPDAKDKYEAYKEKRIAAARRWFHACPEADRTADLFNEMLYMLRARPHRASFDALLVEYRGAPIRSADDERVVLAQTEKPPQMEELAVPPIQVPQWRTTPNGKTFELLIQRSRYMHDWSAMWDLYEEMRGLHIRGTRKLYQALLVEARHHAPSKILKRNAMDVSTFVMRLYEEMKSDHIDVRSLDSTLSVVNAWSATRGQRRWT